MAENTRFLLGFGERLTERIAPPGGGGGSDPAYDFAEAIDRIGPMVANTSAALMALPAQACPDDEAVGVVTLHPQWIAKSYHPQQLLNQYSLRQVGSRPVSVEPEKWTRKDAPAPAPTTEIYVAGKRDAFARWSTDAVENPATISDQIRRLERVRAPQAEERLRASAEDINESPLEVVLHANSRPESEYIVAGFLDFASLLGVEVDVDRRLYVGGLCFIPAYASGNQALELAQYSFLRVARPMPRLRSIAPIERSQPLANALPAPVPDVDAVDPDLRIAVFDGGLADSSGLTRWAHPVDAPSVGAPVDALLDHGHDVTSAALFGPLLAGEVAPRPFAVVDHYRVLDDQCGSDPYDLYDVLRRIDDVLSARPYEFFNLSIGPALPIEDDDVHSWTSLLDDRLSDGRALATIAVGNNGSEDRPSGAARVQVPGDSVNAFSIGAADSSRDGWLRAPYSAVGPGRSPGKVKPDVVCFGGDRREPFQVYDASNMPNVAVTCGTSFASPSALRLAAGVRAHFGGRISPLALKALLTHAAVPNEESREDVGWGRLPADLAPIVLCEDGMARVLYQGELSPSQYLRARLPLPDASYLSGLVSIEATFCYACPTDPQDPGSYTRSGLEVTFRPHSGRFSNQESTIPESKSFFKRTEYDTENSLRNDAHKWDTTLHGGHRMRATSLHEPVFDIHYNARSGGGAAQAAEKMRYALVLTVRSPKTPDLYDEVVRAFAGRIEPLIPAVAIPIQV